MLVPTKIHIPYGLQNQKSEYIFTFLQLDCLKEVFGEKNQAMKLIAWCYQFPNADVG